LLLLHGRQIHVHLFSVHQRNLLLLVSTKAKRIASESNPGGNPGGNTNDKQQQQQQQQQQTLEGAVLPSALGVAGDVVLQAVLLDLQRVVEGAVQLLHRHLDGPLGVREVRGRGGSRGLGDDDIIIIIIIITLPDLSGVH